MEQVLNIHTKFSRHMILLNKIRQNCMPAVVLTGEASGMTGRLTLSLQLLATASICCVDKAEAHIC